MKEPIRVLGVGVWWGDGAANDPDLCFLLDRKPVWDVYEKRSCMQETLSGEQNAVVGTRLRGRLEGWNLYYSADGDFAWFFTWGGKPDDGFGRWRRTVKLTEGTEEEIIGGWHVSGEAATNVGFPPLVDCSYRTDYFQRGDDRVLAGGTACFITQERFAREVAVHLPNCEVIPSRYKGLTVKWRDRPSKADFMEGEKERKSAIRDRLKAKYYDGSWHGGNWYAQTTKEEREDLSTRPYSKLGGDDERNDEFPRGFPEEGQYVPKEVRE